MYILSFSARIGNLLEQHANPHAGKTNLWLLALYATVALYSFVQREIYLFIIPITSELALWGIAYLHALFIVCCLDLVHICSRLTNGFRIVTTNAESQNKWGFERPSSFQRATIMIFVLSLSSSLGTFLSKHRGWFVNRPTLCKVMDYACVFIGLLGFLIGPTQPESMPLRVVGSTLAALFFIVFFDVSGIFEAFAKKKHVQERHGEDGWLKPKWYLA